MELPTKTQELVLTCLEKMRSDPRHLLTFSDREAIYDSFGLLLNDEVRDEKNNSWWMVLSKASQVLGWLAVLTARKVLPIWEQNPVPNDPNDKIYSHDPLEMLEIAEGVLRETVDADTIRGGCVDRFYFGTVGVQNFTSANAADAMETAFAALNVGFCGKESYRDGRDFTITAITAYALIDENLPGVAWKASLNAIESGEFFDPELVRVEDSRQKEWVNIVCYYKPVTIDTQKVLEFWEWWLAEAIPQAWEMAYQNP